MTQTGPAPPAAKWGVTETGCTVCLDRREYQRIRTRLTIVGLVATASGAIALTNTVILYVAILGRL